MSRAGADIRVRGDVQGVGYRYFCYTRATALGVSGWVKNLVDGSVVVYAEGDRSVVEALIEELKVGPRHATVSDVEVRWSTFTGKHHSFQISR